MTAADLAAAMDHLAERAEHLDWPSVIHALRRETPRA